MVVLVIFSLTVTYAAGVTRSSQTGVGPNNIDMCINKAIDCSYLFFLKKTSFCRRRHQVTEFTTFESANRKEGLPKKGRKLLSSFDEPPLFFAHVTKSYTNKQKQDNLKPNEN